MADNQKLIPDRLADQEPEIGIYVNIAQTQVNISSSASGEVDL
jgi:hypothetical protein